MASPADILTPARQTELTTHNIAAGLDFVMSSSEPVHMLALFLVHSVHFSTVWQPLSSAAHLGGLDELFVVLMDSLANLLSAL